MAEGGGYHENREREKPSKNYYDVLGVSPGVTKNDLKRAYRQRARETHPDVNKRKEAEAQFKEVNEANEVLSDPKKRARYDQELGYKASGRNSTGGSSSTSNRTGQSERQSNATEGGANQKSSTNNSGNKTEAPRYNQKSEEEILRENERKRKKAQQAEQRSRKMSEGLADVCWDEISDGKKRAENIELLLDVGRYISSDIKDPRITVKLSDKIALFTAAENVLYGKGLNPEEVKIRIGRLRAFMVGLGVEQDGDSKDAIFEFERRRSVESKKRVNDDVLVNTNFKLEEFKERWKANVAEFNQLDLKDDELWIMPNYLKDKKIEAVKQDTEKRAKELASIYGSLLYENEGAKLQAFLDAGLGKVGLFNTRDRRGTILERFDNLADKGINRFEEIEKDRMFIVFKRENPGIEPGSVMAEFNEYLITVGRALKYDSQYAIDLLAKDGELVTSRYDNELFDFGTKFSEELTIKRKDAKKHIKRGTRWYLRSINQ